MYEAGISEEVEEDYEEGDDDEGYEGEEEGEERFFGTGYVGIVDVGCAVGTDIAVKGVLSFEAMEALAALKWAVCAQCA